MAQHDYVIDNGTGAAVRSDLNNALSAIVTHNSGATAPSTTYAFQLWADTTTNTLKLRNAANSAWIELRQLDGDFTSVSVDNGSAAAPSIFFNASGTDTGIYSSGTDAIDFSAAGTRRFGIASGGDLTVYGGNVTLNAQGDLRFADSDSSNWVAFQSPATVSSNVTWTLPSADGTNGQALTTNGSGTLSWTSPASTTDNITAGNTNATVVDTGSDGHFKVTTEGTERLRINSSGNVGIGTTTLYNQFTVGASSAFPVAKISRTDASFNSGVLALGDGNSANVNVGVWRGDANSASSPGNYLNLGGYDGIVFAAGNNAIGSQNRAATIDTSGRLLLGTSTARSTFFGTETGVSQLEGTTGVIQTIVGNANQQYANPALVLAKSRGTSVGSVTVVQSGDVIGRISFQGADGTKFVQAADIYAEVDGTPGANDMPGRLVFSTTADGASSPTERMRITNSGEARIQSVYDLTTSNGANVFVYSNGAMVRSTSSAKYKTNIETIEDSYSDALLKCRPVWYQSTSSKDNPDWGWWGFIAEEVAEIDPRLVHWKTTESVVQENGSIEHVPCNPEPEGVQYDRFVPHLLNLIKRQQQAIENLEAKVAALEAS